MYLSQMKDFSRSYLLLYGSFQEIDLILKVHIAIFTVTKFALAVVIWLYVLLNIFFLVNLYLLLFINFVSQQELDVPSSRSRRTSK